MDETVLDLLRGERLVAIVRSQDVATAVTIGQRLIDADVRMVEIAWTTPGAAQVLLKLSHQAPEIVWGAGTILSATMAEEALASGASFLVAPDFNADVWQITQKHGIAYIPGVWSATEIGQALRYGLTVLKLFPAQTGGIAHMRALHEPFPQVAFVPTGGVTPDNSRDWLDAGAVAVGMGGALSRLSIAPLRTLAQSLRLRTPAS